MPGPTFHGPPSRRTVLKTAAIGGVGLAAWTVPVVEVFSMTASNAEAVSGPPTPPTFSVDPTTITAPPDSGDPGNQGGSEDPGGLTTAPGGGGGALGGAAPQNRTGATQLASTGVTLPVGATAAVAVGAIAAGAAAVVLGNRTSSTETAAEAAGITRGPRRH